VCRLYSAACPARAGRAKFTFGITQLTSVISRLLLVALLTVGGAGLFAACPSPAHALNAPNVVIIDRGIVTSGQPTAESLATLRAEGFEAVIYLAPASVGDAVKEEPTILARQGIEFVHVPIPFTAPTESHFDAVSAALDRLKGKKILIHCQVNMRASTMVFLYRVLHRKEAPAAAYDAVTQVWTPQGPWKQLAQGLLDKGGVKFELY
jgi:protein tyrosine phosphatase (PTP) superfamily phosphohydrolase (DUF442 family)